MLMTTRIGIFLKKLNLNILNYEIFAMDGTMTHLSVNVILSVKIVTNVDSTRFCKMGMFFVRK